jgi:hypothetical protein
MVRVCSHEKCSRPHHVFGCVFYTGKVVHCDDCKLVKTGIYQQCAVRMIEPSPDDSMEGLCDSCARIIRDSRERNKRKKTHTGCQAAASF